MKTILRILGILLAVILLLAGYLAITWYVQFRVLPEKELRSYKGENVEYPFVNGSFQLPMAIDIEFSVIPGELKEYIQDKAGPRNIISLNGTWEVEEGDLSKIPEAFTHTVPVPGFVDMAVPEFSQPGEIKTIVGLGILRPSGLMTLMKFRDKQREAFWYRKVFKIEETLPAVAILKIGKAKYGSEVWLNGSRLGENSRHFLSGTYDVSGILKGQGAENELVVRVGTSVTYRTNNKNIYGDVLEKTKQLPGIYDDVELILTGSLYVEKVQVHPQLDRKSVRVMAWIQNRSKEEASTQLKFQIQKDSSLCNAVESKRVSIPPGETAVFDTDIPLKEIETWSPETPSLYTLIVQSSDDLLSTTFGMREFHFDPDTKVPVLNGQTYYLRGTSVPIYRFAEDPMRGDKLWDEEWVRALFRKFKEMHWNSLRFHVGPAPSMWYRIADEEGIIIQDEYAIWTFNLFRSGIKLDTLVSEYVDWMEERWNHASLLIWDAQNESVQKKEPRTGWALSMVRELDLSDRPWDNGWGEAQSETDPMELHPYLYSGSMFNFFGKDLKPLPAVDTFSHTNPDSILLMEGTHPALVNEYAWLWLNRDGEGTVLTEQGYKTYFPEFSASDRFEYYAYHCALQTEYYRALRAAGVMQFAGLNSNYKGSKTSDIFIDIENLVIEPHIWSYVRDAFSPEAVCLWFWEDQLTRGSKITIPIILLNDLPVPIVSQVKISFVKDYQEISQKTVPAVLVGPSGKEIIQVNIEFPGEPGDYRLIAEIIDQNNNPVRSVRKIEIR